MGPLPPSKPPTGSVAVGDFNGDGRPDLAAANFSSNTVSVLLNTTPLNFVQALYLRFLRRVGDLASPADAGAWVAALDAGAPPAAVASAIARSAEALTLLVDGLYRAVLQREPDAGGRLGWFNALAGGATLEAVTAGFLGSAEYRDRFADSDRVFVRSLYARLLGRGPAEAEVEGWLPRVAALGRAAVAGAFLSSAEYRAREVTRLYREFLRREPGAGEVSACVHSGLDLLRLTAGVAGSAEFQAKG